MISLGGSAGRSSERKYAELTRSWRRRNRRLFAVLALVCGAVIVASLIASQMWPARSWLWGFLGGAAAAFYLIARLSPPGWVENWQQGAWGEQATAKALRPLERDGWTVLHDLPAEHGNVDHVVVGPGGIFLLDSKRPGGRVTVEERDVVTVRRVDDPDLGYTHRGSGHLLGLAREAHDRVLARTRIKVWVSPVMVIWGEFPQRVAQGRCAYIHGEELESWLRSRPQVIADSRLDQIVDALRSSWEQEDALA